MNEISSYDSGRVRLNGKRRVPKNPCEKPRASNFCWPPCGHP